MPSTTISSARLYRVSYAYTMLLTLFAFNIKGSFLFLLLPRMKNQITPGIKTRAGILPTTPPAIATTLNGCLASEKGLRVSDLE